MVSHSYNNHGEAMIKLLMLALVGFVFYSFISSIKIRSGRGQQPKNRSQQGEVMVSDPQCGTYLPQSDALKATIKGQEYFFCSRKCLQEFKKAQRK